MILRSLTLAGGVTAAAATSQFPEFSQQYLQRLGGAVDALEQVVADFDASAAAEGLTRDAALAQMRGTDFIERRRADMARSIDRYETLRQDLTVLEGQGPFTRAYHVTRFTDTKLAKAAWEAYQPALPFNFAGMLFAGAGFLLGLLAVGVGLRTLAWPLRRLRGTRAAKA